MRHRRQQARLIIFFIQLPDPLGLPDGSTFSFELPETSPALADHAAVAVEGLAPFTVEGHLFASFRFWQVSAAGTDPSHYLDAVEQAMRHGIPSRLLPDPNQESPEWQESPGVRTVVEAVTPILFGPTRRDPVTDAFERCLASLRQLIRAYRVSENDLIPLPTRERLPFAIPYFQRSLDDPEDWLGMSLFLLHMNVEVPPEPLDAAAMDRFSIHLSLLQREHPLIPYREQTLEARRAFDLDGDYARAVVSAQTAAEILLDGVLTLMLWEENVDPSRAAGETFSESLPKRVRTAFPPRLGGDWSTRGTGPLNTWVTVLALLRGRIVHAAYVPTMEEAEQALAAGDELDAFVRSRLVAKRNDFPRTTLLTLGRPGLERHGAWSGSIRRFAEEQAAAEPDWVVSYREWRRELDEARS